MRLKKEEEKEYKRKLEEALALYKDYVGRGEAPPDPEWFINEFNLEKRGQYITKKRWYSIIYKTPGVTSYRQEMKRRKNSILNDVEHGISKKAIISKYGISEDDYKKLVSKSQPTLRQESLVYCAEACDLYKENYSIEKISKKLGKCTHTIVKLLKIGGLNPRTQAETSIRYPDLRANYFRSINNEKKAWVLGLIYADGSINQKCSLQVSQSVENDHVLKIIADELNYPGEFTRAEKSHTTKMQSVLTVSRCEIQKDLLRLGMTTNKEIDLRFPFLLIDKKYYWAFLSGLYNGDGSLSLSIKENPRVKNQNPGLIFQLDWGITSTKEMCEDISVFLKSQIPEIKTNIRKEADKNASRITISSSRAHILSLVRLLDDKAFGIQILDKYDKAAFFQRRSRRIAAIKAVRSCTGANLLSALLNDRLENLKNSGMLLKDIAKSLDTDRSSLRKICQGLTFPATNLVLSRFCTLLNLEEKDFIDWSLLESQNLIPPAWDLKDPHYIYHGLHVGPFGEVIRN